MMQRLFFLISHEKVTFQSSYIYLMYDLWIIYEDNILFQVPAQRTENTGHPAGLHFNMKCFNCLEFLHTHSTQLIQI